MSRHPNVQGKGSSAREKNKIINATQTEKKKKNTEQKRQAAVYVVPGTPYQCP